MSCGKHPYPDRTAAGNAVRVLEKKRKRQGRRVEVEVYRCPDCGKYHTTSRATRDPSRS